MYDEKANRAYYSSRGLCPYCNGKRAVTPGFKTCQPCRDRKRKNEKNRRQRHRDEGTCVRCGAPLEEGSKRKWCQTCRDDSAEKFGEKRRILLRHMRAERRDEGKCTRCGIRYAEPGRSECRACLDKRKGEHKKYDPDHARHNAMRQRWVDAGLCVDCGKPVQGDFKRCPACLERQRDSCRKYKILKRMDREAALARKGVYRSDV